MCLRSLGMSYALITKRKCWIPATSWSTQRCRFAVEVSGGLRVWESDSLYHRFFCFGATTFNRSDREYLPRVGCCCDSSCIDWSTPYGQYGPYQRVTSLSVLYCAFFPHPLFNTPLSTRVHDMCFPLEHINAPFTAN